MFFQLCVQVRQHVLVHDLPSEIFLIIELMKLRDHKISCRIRIRLSINTEDLPLFKQWLSESLDNTLPELAVSANYND